MFPIPILKLLPEIITAVFVAGLALFLNHAEIITMRDSLAHEKTKALSEQAVLLQSQCQMDKQLTQEVSSAYQDKINALNKRIAALRMRKPVACIPIMPSSKPATGHDATAGDKGLPAPHGVSSDDLYGYSRDAEQIGLQLDACQDFINKTWKMLGQ